MMTKAEFGGSVKVWDELAGRILTSYDLPRWAVPCSPEAMRLWAERLDLGPKTARSTKTAYEGTTNTTMEEFIELNPGWPLRSFVGLVLEEVNHQTA